MTISVWDVATGERRGVLRSLDGGGDLAWSPDGRYLAIDSAPGLQVWDLGADTYGAR